MPFEFAELAIPGVVLVSPRIFLDNRGFFLETYKESDFHTAGLPTEFVQDNHSLSAAGTLRGIHYQLPPFQQGKLVRVITGRALDVAVDLRASSATYMHWTLVELTGENHRMLYVPPGFGHGFLAMEDGTHLAYKCTAEYSKGHERGVLWNDPELAIDWPNQSPHLSHKDSNLPLLGDAEVFA